MSIRFVFDFISPYAYVGWHRVKHIAAAHGRSISTEPVLFAGLLDAHGQLGPAEIPAKRRFVFKDALRKAHRAGLKLAPPPRHPFNPLGALRVVHLLEGHARTQAIDACFAAVWGGGGGVDTPEGLIAALDGAGLDGAALLARTREPAIKQGLRAATEAAVAEGVFGVPTFIVDGELFWGTDSLVDLEGWLRGEDPVPADLDRLWLELPAGARRPGGQRGQRSAAKG